MNGNSEKSSLQVTLAAHFEKAQRSLTESHESALRLVHQHTKYVQDKGAWCDTLPGGLHAERVASETTVVPSGRGDFQGPASSSPDYCPVVPFVSDMKESECNSECHTPKSELGGAGEFCQPSDMTNDKQKIGGFLEYAEGKASQNSQKEVYVPCSCWKRNHRHSFQQSISVQPLRLHAPGPEFVLAISHTDPVDNQGEGWRRKLILRPDSNVRACWDIGSLVMVTYDMFSIPFSLFDPPKSAALIVSGWIVRIFWTWDVFMSFLTGFMMYTGQLEMRPGKIAQRYFKTWFPMDLFINLIDWLDPIFSGADGDVSYANFGRALRVFRILRFFRLLRLLRMKQVIKGLLGRIHSKKLTIVMDVLKIQVILGAIAHVQGCCWFGISDAALFSGSAAETTMVDATGLKRRPLAYQYFSCLHWALTQFSGGMDEFIAHNTVERVYVVFTGLVDFVLAIVFVSELTSSITQLHMISVRQTEQLSILKNYLSNNFISRRLSQRVIHNATHALSEQQKSMPEDQVELLDIISMPLKKEIHFEMFSVILQKHPFFERYSDECPHVMRQVCHLAMSMSLVSSGDTIFHAGETPAMPKMYFVTSGLLQYTSISGQVIDVKEEDWIAEAALWTSWTHRGVLTAQSDCKICIMDVKVFQDIVQQFDHPDFDPSVYAIEFVEALNHHHSSSNDLCFLIDDSCAVGSQSERRVYLQNMLTKAVSNRNRNSRGRQSSNARMMKSALDETSEHAVVTMTTVLPQAPKFSH